MPDVVSSLIQLFADDTKIFSQISSPEDHQILQDDLRSLEDWASKWQLRFNATKCKVMHLGHGNPHYNYVMENNVVLASTNKEKDLGVIVDNSLSFSDHIATQVN